MWNYKCPICGANLDPGEACDCDEVAVCRPERRMDFERTMGSHVKLNRRQNDVPSVSHA